MSSKAAYIRGPLTPSYRSINAFIPRINYTQLTDGELSVKLVARQLQLRGLATGKDQYLEESKALNQILQSRLTGKDIYTKSQLTNWAKRKIRNNDFPAIGATYFKPRIGNLVSFQDYQQAENQACKKILEQWHKTPVWRFKKKNELRKEWERCLEAAKYLNVVNQHLETSGAHILYTFAGAKTTGTIETKKVMHNVAIDNYANIFGLSRENIKLWVQNGITAKMLDKGGEFEYPKEIIDFMVKNVGPNYDRVGALPVVALIKTVLEVALLALAATQAILSAFPPKDYIRATANTYGLGNESFGPQKDDFVGKAIESGAIWPILAALGLLWFSK